MSARLFLLCTVVVCFLGSTYAIECFSCKGDSDDDACGDKDYSNTHTIKELSSNQPCTQCLKIKNDEDGSTNRGCVHADEDLFPNKCFFTESIPKTGICYCDEDKCNSGSAHTVSLLMLTCLVLVLLRYQW